MERSQGGTDGVCGALANRRQDTEPKRCLAGVTDPATARSSLGCTTQAESGLGSCDPGHAISGVMRRRRSSLGESVAAEMHKFGEENFEAKTSSRNITIFIDMKCLLKNPPGNAVGC